MKNSETKITARYLRSTLIYDPETGVFVWRWRRGLDRRANMRFANRPAGSKRADGYWGIRIDGKPYMRHRLAWLYVTGRWPKDEIDHKNRTRGDDRFSNLREATRAQNRFNNKIYSTNTSGAPGVYWHKKNKKWIANISINDRPTYLGSFESMADAASAYAAKSLELRGEFSAAA